MIEEAGKYIPELVGAAVAFLLGAAKLIKMIIAYMPSEKVVKEGHSQITLKLDSITNAMKEDHKENVDHRVYVAESLGAINASLVGLDQRQGRAEERIGRVERRQGTGGFPRPNMPTVT